MRSVPLLLITAVLFLQVIPANAETCPAASEIVERQISKLYEWTVQEGTTLDDLLSVNRLYSVRIHQDGGFVSCGYTTSKWPVRLDAKPEVDECHIKQTGGEWKELDEGEQVCADKNLYACEFHIECDEN